jgi:chromosome segregation ATPase
MEEPTSSPNSLETAAALSAEALRELRQRTQSALKASREHAVRLEADITRQLDELAETLSAQLDADVQNSSEHEKEHAEVARLTEALETLQKESTAERKAFELEQEELTKKVADLESRNRASQEEWRNQLLGFESRLRDQHQSWNEQRAEWTAARTDLERERDEVQQKFELALRDVQQLRESIAELEHDLARRPAADQADSTELVALRAERDALSQRVQELEQHPAAPLDSDTEQQMSDLQRRFELAVEDVRELKTKNAQLESQLSNVPTGSACRLDTGGMDWESQKRRMLAALEESTEEDNGDADRQQERATIQGTIEITDSVVAEKDRQIALLEAKLEAAAEIATAEGVEVHSGKINELIDADEVIAGHRQRHQELEREMESKLRAAELELSVERAKMARQRVELEELKSSLDKERQLYESSGGPVAPGAPKRRWLSKLGIDGKDKE